MSILNHCLQDFICSMKTCAISNIVTLNDTVMLHGALSHCMMVQCYTVQYIYERSSSTKLKLNESTKRNARLILRDTSPWQANNSEECDVVRRDRYFLLSCTPRLFASKTMLHDDRTR